MKNIFILTFVLFTPVTLFAEDNSSSDIDYYAGGSVSQLNYDGESYTGYGVGFSAVSEKFTFSAGYDSWDLDGDDFDITGAEVTYSFGSNFEGSFYVGLDYTSTKYKWYDSESDTGFSIGYHKITPNELSWDVGISESDGDAAVGVGIRIPVEENFGIRVGFSTLKDEDDDRFNMANIGFDYSF